eukprot:gene33068-42779_t
MIVPVDEKSIITNDFTSGNFEQTSSRGFDFPIHTIPNSAEMTFNINDNDFTDVKYLSSGSNVLVYTGIRNQEFIVVKMLKSDSKFKRVAVEELNLEMQILAKVNHENIIRIIGAGEKPRKFIILEYLGGGTLDKLLDEMTIQEKSLQKQKSHGHLPLTLSLRWQTALPIAIQLATVLKYLHDDFHRKAAIIHRDLKPQNIGFTEEGQLKLFDFGLAACVKKKQLASDAYEMTGHTGTLVYMAPEVYLNQPYNEKVDVYSFAMIIWETISGEQVFSTMSKEQHMQQVVLGGHRPALSVILERAPVGVARLLERCWHPDHRLRPSFATILRDLATISDEESAGSTPSSVHTDTTSVSRGSAGPSTWTTMLSGSSTVHVDRETGTSSNNLNQAAASMKVVSKRRTKPVAKKQSFLGSCLSLKM